MMNEFTLTLNNPLTEEQWDIITDVDFEHTSEITFHTKHGKEVVFVKKSAQPEIIRCKDCKYGVHAGCGNTYLCVVSPEDRLEHKYDFWCAYAERRTE